MKAAQLNFDKISEFKDFKYRIEHGGEIRLGKRKLQRPFDSQKSLHINLRSRYAKGSWSFLKSRHENKIRKIVYGYAERFNIRIFSYANSGNHLHILAKARSRKGFQKYLRTVTGLIPRIVTGARRGKGFGKFWDNLAYTKLVKWGKQFQNTRNYVIKNALEGLGIIPPRSQARGHIKINFQELYDG